MRTLDFFTVQEVWAARVRQNTIKLEVWAARARQNTIKLEVWAARARQNTIKLEVCAAVKGCLEHHGVDFDR